MFHKLGVHIFELSGVDDPKKFLAIFYKKSTMITFAFILFISGFTPLPFNLLAITSGFVHFNFPLFVATALFTRGSRYFLLTYLFSKFGPKIQEQIEQTIKDKEGKTFICTSIGKNESGEVVAVFNITWSVKSK